MPDHDPAGLDVARMIAAAAQGVDAAPVRPAKPKRTPREKPRTAGDPKPLGEAIEELIAERGWSTAVSLHHLLGRWATLVGETVAAHTTPEGYADTVLTIRAESTGWATNLRRMAPLLVAKLNDQLGQGTVSRVVVKGPDAPSWKHGRRTVRDGRGPRDTYG